MSFYAFSAAALQGLSREHWGKKLTIEGEQHDTGVQEFVDELLARLQSTDPIQLSDTMKFIAPANGPAFQVINNSTNETIINEIGVGTPGQALADVSVSSVTTDTSGLTVDISVSACDVTATISGSVVTTVSLSKTFITVLVPA